MYGPLPSQERDCSPRPIATAQHSLRLQKPWKDTKFNNVSYCHYIVLNMDNFTDLIIIIAALLLFLISERESDGTRNI